MFLPLLLFSGFAFCAAVAESPKARFVAADTVARYEHENVLV